MATKRTLILLLIAAVSGCGGPLIYGPDEAPEAIQFRAQLSYYGLAFLGDRLYATTSEGILEFTDGRLTALIRWFWSKYGMIGVDGPWRDETDDSLWFKEHWSLDLIRRTRDGWEKVPLPRPKADYVDIVRWATATLKGGSNAKGFWLSSPLEAWQWKPGDRSWVDQSLPRDAGGVFAVLPVESGLLAVATHDRMRVGNALEGTPFQSDSVHRLQPGQEWRPVTGDLDPFVAVEVVSIGASAWIRTFPKGELLRVEDGRIDRVAAPGACEALARTSDGMLLASFDGKGIYQRQGAGWDLKYPCPYAATVGRHRACLAARDGRVAFAVSALRPNAANPEAGGLTALWISREGRLERIDW
jgi:hypothetical protein